MYSKLLAIIAICVIFSSCSSSVRFSSETKTNIKSNKKSNPEIIKNSQITPNVKFRGVASYYDDKFEGRMTANGEIFNQFELTAAHNTLPFGTIVKVTNLKNGKTVHVRINDRGPFAEGRIIDLSKSAAAEIGMLEDGIAEVEIEIIGLK